MNQNPKNYNVVWAIVDSVRHYHTEGDDRTRLDFMDEFAEESIEFTHVITSAPSTVMSISAMMTSLPSFYLGRNYSDFRFDNDYFTTLSSILNSEGYETRALIMHPDIRDKLRVFDLISSKYWPKGFSHKDWWDNSKINLLLKNSLKIDGSNAPHPCFWFLDFNCREDPNTSNIVKDSFQALNKAGYTKDNTIFILCSDHGYPDPKRGITPQALKEQNMSHDIFMTEDNIRIPMFISYPGCEEGKKINEIISTLDLKPTILDLLNISVDREISSRWHGKSLVKLIQDKEKNYDTERLIRVDARFFGQPGRVSALSGRNFKYIYHHDTGLEELIDLSNYLEDEINVIDKVEENPHLAELLSKYRESFKNSEDNGINFQINYAVNKLSSFFEKHVTENPKILITSYLPSHLLDSIGSAVSSILNGPEIYISCFEDESSNNNLKFMALNHSHDSIVFKDSPPQILNFDICIYVTDHSSSNNDDNFKKFIKRLKPRKYLTLDLNMSVSINKGQISRYIKTLYHKRDFFKEEPSLIFFEIKKIFKVVIKKFKQFVKK